MELESHNGETGVPPWWNFYNKFDELDKLDELYKLDKLQ